MTRLTRYARGPLVALAALALTAGAAIAARNLAPASSIGADHGNTAGGGSTQVGKPGPRDAAPGKDAEVADEAETPETAPAPDANADGERPQNHGWFVSEAANAETPAGFDNHGAYVSSIAHGTAGKPDAAAKGATKSEAGKAKGDAAKTTRTER